MKIRTRSLVPLLVILALASACGPKTIQTVRKADVGVYAALAAVQDAEGVLYAGGQITAEQHKAVNAKLVPVLKAGRDFNRAVASWKPGTPTPLELATLTQRLGDLVGDLSAYLSAGSRDALMAKVAIAQQAILAVLAGLAVVGG